jgi:hypothetical protein
MKKLKHVRLFESFDSDPAQKVIDMMMADPDFSGYRLSPRKDSDITFIVWENPEENQKWMESGYGENYTPGDDASMPILGITPDGTMFKLAPEEKYSYIYSDEGDSGSVYNRKGDIDYPRVKSEIEDSIWEYEG